MGAEIRESFGYIYAEATRLYGADIQLDYPSVGATENLMMSAALADGTTQIRNAAREPEIVEVQNFLNQMGARIRGAGTDSSASMAWKLYIRRNTPLSQIGLRREHTWWQPPWQEEVVIHPVIPQHVSTNDRQAQRGGY